MLTSSGYHTFTISYSLTQETAASILFAFKRYRDATSEICIIEREKYAKDPFARHYEIVYPNSYKGISWKMRFCNKGFIVQGEFKPCSIKVTINPKILAGENNYIVAATADYIDKIEEAFNTEARKISPLLGEFSRYSLNRIDYCVNFDSVELFDNCHPGVLPCLPEAIMKLLKRADIPDHFSENFKNSFQFYLKSDSVVINCYWKYGELRDKFPNCPSIEDSRNIIRFEVQCKYPKVYAKASKIKKQREDVSSIIYDKLRNEGFFEFSENPREENLQEKGDVWRLLKEVNPSKYSVLKEMLSDSYCADVISEYFKKVVKSGNYYTYSMAHKKINSKVSSWEKVMRLSNALKLIAENKGIANAKALLKDKELETFRRSLRELAQLEINPVTIPDEWGVEYLPNLLDSYYRKIADGVPLTVGKKRELVSYNMSKYYESISDDEIAELLKGGKKKAR